MIHQYINNGYHIVLDVNSGSVHVVDEAAYRAIPAVEKALGAGKETAEEIGAYVAPELSDMTDEEIAETVAEILALRDAGMLYTEDIYEKYIDSFKNRETVVKAADTASQRRESTTADGRS